MKYLRFRPASMVKRIVAFFIDVLPIQFGLYLVSIWGFGVSPIMDVLARPENQVASLISRSLIEFGTFGIWIAYCIVAELSPWRGTFGKKLMGIAVQPAFGGRLSVGRIIGRNAGKVLSMIPCWAGFFAAIFTYGNRAWHDMLSSTAVVERR